MLTPASFFELSGFEHASIFEGVDLVWEALKRLPEYAMGCFGLSAGHLHQPLESFQHLVSIASDAVVEPGAQVLGPVVVGPHCHIAASSVLRGPVVLGASVYVGRYSEVKAS